MAFPIKVMACSCKIIDGFMLELPESPDINQIGVNWVKLTELKDIALYSNIKEHIINYTNNKINIELL
ncbi:hypothetical protein [Niallia sp. FSL R7-0271]|uniref:hypothetical protein n=1 Tax=Niallia sp. FSL R7-0271 TaxID=2921678 RepID=UPI0030FC9121